MRTLVDATDRYFLQHGYGDGSWSFDDLDIEIPTEFNNWDIYADECADGGCTFIAESKWETDYAIRYVSQRYGNGEDATCGKFSCGAYTDDAKKICKQLGGVQIEDDGNNYYI